MPYANLATAGEGVHNATAVRTAKKFREANFGRQTTASPIVVTSPALAGRFFCRYCASVPAGLEFFCLEGSFFLALGAGVFAVLCRYAGFLRFRIGQSEMVDGGVVGLHVWDRE